MCLTAMSTMQVNLSISVPQQRASASSDQTLSAHTSASWSGPPSSDRRATAGPQDPASLLPVHSDRQSPERQPTQRGLQPPVNGPRKQTIPNGRGSDSDRRARPPGSNLNSNSYSKDNKADQGSPASTTHLGEQTVKQTPDSKSLQTVKQTPDSRSLQTVKQTPDSKSLQTVKQTPDSKSLQTVKQTPDSKSLQTVKQTPNSTSLTRSGTIVIRTHCESSRESGAAREKGEGDASVRTRSGRRRRDRTPYDDVGAGRKRHRHGDVTARHRAFVQQQQRQQRVRSSKVSGQNQHDQYLDVSRMDAVVGTDYGDRLYQIQQIQLRQQERRVPSPYPIYDFKKPEDFHPSYQTKDPESFQPQHDPRGQGHPSYDSRAPGKGFTMSEYPKTSSGGTFLTQNRTEPYGAGFGDEAGDPYGKLRAREPNDYRDDVRSDPLHSRHGSMTDDDKMNESERDRDRGDRDRERESAASDEEAERGLEMLRQLHEQAEAARRLDESDDATERRDERREKKGRRVPGEQPGGAVRHYDGPDSGSDTPTNRHRDERSDEDETGRGSDENERRRYDEGGGRYYYPQQRPGEKNAGTTGDAQRDHPGRHPASKEQSPGGEVYYSLSKRHYHPELPSSEPSYSRDGSPRPPDPGHRAQSQQQLRLVYDSNDLSGRSSVDDPGITFDRYARRASRASVLSKAEQLLNARRQSQLRSISESGGETPTGQTTRPPPQRKAMAGTRRVAFVEEEEEEEGESDRSSGGGFQDALSSFRSRGSGVHVVDSNTVRRSRLQQLNAKIKSSPFRNLHPVNVKAKTDNARKQRSVPNRRGRQRRRHQRRIRMKRKFINTVRAVARMAMLRNRTRRLRQTGAQTLSDYDQYSSGSEEDVVHYGLPNYDDPSRYEMPRVRPPAPNTSDRIDLEQNSKKARRVWFFRNGDPDFKAKLVLVSQKTYPNFETLLVALGQIVPTVAGVKYIFSWPEGKEIKSVTELQNGRYYVCASVNRLTRVNYGNSREQFWKGGKLQHDESHLFTKKNGSVVSSPNHPRPLVITVISNMYRDSHEKLILNPNTTQNFEDVLADLQNMVTIPHPPVRALYTESKPHIKVEGFSHLFRELKDHKNFLVCGEEGVPIEPKKRPLPSSNSSNDSLTGKGSLRNSKQARPDIARISSDSVSPSRRPGYKRTEPVRCDINGKKREFFAPSVPFMDSDGMKPEKKLKLEWVYGFRGRDVKQNLVILPNTGELVYFVAAIIVLYDRKTHTQKHYTSHTEEVTCLALHPRYPYIASGQVAGRSPEGAAHVRIWDGLKLSTYAVIGIGVFQQGISCLSFSESDTNGDLLLAIDDSDRHVMSVWEWTREDLDQPSAKTTTTNDPVVYGCFYPFDDKILITFGKQHMYFWTVFWNRVDGRILRDKKSGLFEDDVPKYVTSVCFAANRDVITGDSTGSILVWSPDDDDIFRIDRQASVAMKFAHKKSVASMTMLSDGVLLSGGGNEIKAWDSLMRFKLIKERVLPEVYGTIRKVVPVTTTGVDGYMFVGTAKDIILEGSLQSKFRPIVQGHSEELWAVKPHPTEPSFFTAGHDCSLIKWSTDDHTVIWTTKDKKPCTSIAVDPLGQLVAVGTTTGKVTLYGCGDGDGRERNSFQVGQAQVNAMSFSPDGSQLAVGSHDGFVHVYVIHEDGQIFRQQSAALRHNSTFIMHLDWSSDCRYIQTVLGDYDLVFWDVHNMQKLKTGRTLRDVNWSTFSSPVGYPLIGAWQAMERGEVINVACRSKYLDYILTGDSRGRLRLYKYPSTGPKAEYRQVKPFSSNTTAAEFLSDDTGILASGGNDAALVQYALVDR